MRRPLGLALLFVACGSPPAVETPTAPVSSSSSSASDAGASSTTTDAIGVLVADLSKQLLWSNGLAPTIELPGSSPIPQVTDRAVTAVSFENGKISKYEILETRTVKIGADPKPYTAVRIASNQGEKIVLLRFDTNTWWSRVFPSANEPPATKPGLTSMRGGAQACNKDTDCEVVETKCCDHCNGGEVQAFNVMVADQYRPECGPTPCTRRACSPASASCVNGHCVINTP